VLFVLVTFTFFTIFSHLGEASSFTGNAVVSTIEDVFIILRFLDLL
jgi:hypothetical protein